MNPPFPQLLLKRAHIPRLLTEQILLTWRFLLFFWMRRRQFVARKRCVLLLQPAERLSILKYRLTSRLRALMRYQQMTTTLDIKCIRRFSPVRTIMFATSTCGFVIRMSRYFCCLNSGFFARLLPVWWAPTVVGSLRFYEPERPVASAKARLVAGKLLDYSKRGLLAPAPRKLRRFFRTLNSRFILISIAILRLVYVIWGAGGEITRRVDEAGANAGWTPNIFRHQPIQCFESWAKRVAIADAARQARYLLLDEPTAGL